jgi:probable HAF family extracellular repeat protein
MKSWLTLVTAIALLAALANPVKLAAQQDGQSRRLHHYRITVLPTLGGTFSQAFGISDEGWINGGSTLTGDGAVHAFFWRSGIMTDLGTLGGPNSNSYFPLNDSGEVAGLAETSNADPNGEDFCFFGTYLTCLPFVWKNGVMTALPTLGGNNGNALEVNNRGQVAGVTENSTPDPTCSAPFFLQFKPVIWENGEVKELPTFPGDPDGTAGEINDNGQAAGGSGNCTSNPFAHALLWFRGRAIDLGNLGGAMNNVAEDINNRAQVVGASDLPGDTTAHAFLWQNGIMTDLGTLPGDVSSGATGINDKSLIVGNSCDVNSNCRAFIYEGGIMTDLNTLTTNGSSLFLLDASGGTNSRGEVAGRVLDENTLQVHAYRAIPCDEQHPGVEGCDYSMVDAAAAPQMTPAVHSPSTGLHPSLMQRMNRYHFPGFAVGPRN